MLSASMSFGGGRRHLLHAIAALCVLAACGGEEEPAPETAVPPAAGPVATPGGPVTPQLIALGDSIYHGLAGVGGICYTCHGAAGEGLTCPNLTDTQWIHGDGSLDAIATVIAQGVQTPVEYQVPMPAFAGTLTPEQIRAVAAYVAAMSQPGGAAGS